MNKNILQKKLLKNWKTEKKNFFKFSTKNILEFSNFRMERKCFSLKIW